MTLPIADAPHVQFEFSCPSIIVRFRYEESAHPTLDYHLGPPRGWCK